jgi:hypothetical protein
MEAVYKTPYLLKKFKKAQAERATTTIPEKATIVASSAKLRKKMSLKPQISVKVVFDKLNKLVARSHRLQTATTRSQKR